MARACLPLHAGNPMANWPRFSKMPHCLRQATASAFALAGGSPRGRAPSRPLPASTALSGRPCSSASRRAMPHGAHGNRRRRRMCCAEPRAQLPAEPSNDRAEWWRCLLREFCRGASPVLPRSMARQHRRPHSLVKCHSIRDLLVPGERIELPTNGLQNRCSTAELTRRSVPEHIRARCLGHFIFRLVIAA